MTTEQGGLDWLIDSDQVASDRVAGREHTVAVDVPDGEPARSRRLRSVYAHAMTTAEPGSLEQPRSPAPLPPDARRATALLVGVSATVAFVLLRVVVALGGHEPLTIDVWWHDLMVATLSAVGVVVAWVPAIVGGTIGMIIVGIVLVGLLLWRRRRWDAASLAIAIVAVVAIGASMAAVIARGRPDDSLAESTATSVPSPHGSRNDCRGRPGTSAPALVRLAAGRRLGHRDDVEPHLPPRALAQRRGRRDARGHRPRDPRLVRGRGPSRSSRSPLRRFDARVLSGRLHSS